MSRLERGKLSRIVRPYNDPESLDLYVTTVRPAKLGESVVSKGGDYHTYANGENGWICDASKPTFPRVIAAQCLRPLDGPGDDEADLLLAPLPADFCVEWEEFKIATQELPA